MAWGAFILGLVSTIPARADGLAGAQPTKSEYGVIFHIDSGDQATIKKTLNNVENLMHDPRFKDRKLHVELIANSKGFAVYVKGNGFEKRLEQLKADGVELAQCSNTLRELHVDRGDLYSFIQIVPSGMGEITIRQAEGWAYIHPSSPPASDL
ncbi:MAG TPA: DsrE family protein [Burkholderiales bacterium]|nr:DsrE family protein [Burkholderiales bacterium]